MSKIVSIHSFRGGTGKSNTTANLAALLAMDGARVGVVDTDINSPGIHVLFNFDESEMKHSLNDYLWGKCTIEEAAHDVTGHLGGEVKGQIFLIPSSIKPGEIARILRVEPNTAKVRLHRARARLKEKMETHFAAEVKDLY